MSIEYTECGIDVPRIMPTLCGICIKRDACRAKKALYFVGAAPLFTVEDENRKVYENRQLDEFDLLEQEDAPANTELSAEIKQEQAAEIEAQDLALCAEFGKADLLSQFPKVGRFEDTIYRPSAWELAAAMPDYTPAIEQGQLVLKREIIPGSVVWVWTSITVGNIAGGTGDDSIRVVRVDTAGDKTFRFKNKQDWITRQVPKSADTPEKAAAHLAAKIETNISQFVRTCPTCGATQVKCKGFWKGCRHSA